MDTNGVRRWRISGVLPFPKREAVEIPGETPDSLPKKIAFLSRVAPQRRAYGDIAVGLRPFPDNSLPPEMTAGWGPMREPVELSFVTEAVDAEASRAKVRDLVELVVEGLSFQLQEALQYVAINIKDVTPPVAVGEERSFVTAGAFALDKFLRDAPMGTVATAEAVELAEEYVMPTKEIRQALGWYIKALSTQFQADQYIFLWIALDLFAGMSGIAVEVPYTGPNCGHEIPECPVCEKPTTKKLQGESVKRYLTERWGIAGDVAARMWKGRQIMHGAVPFDSEVMKTLPELVQVLRALVASELKLAFGVTLDSLPQVNYGGASINPDWTGLGGTTRITTADLDWP